MPGKEFWVTLKRFSLKYPFVSVIGELFSHLTLPAEFPSDANWQRKFIPTPDKSLLPLPRVFLPQTIISQEGTFSFFLKFSSF